MSLVQTGAASAIAVSASAPLDRPLIRADISKQFTVLKDIERLHDKNMYARTIVSISCCGYCQQESDGCPDLAWRWRLHRPRTLM